MACKETKTAVVLLSGGLDSSTALAWAIKDQGWQCHALAFDYGQRHRVELLSAKKIAHSLCATSYHELAVDLRSIGGSALTDHIDVPRDAHASKDIPVTYVPARNMIFLSLAMALAETLAATQLVIGANVVDYSGYPDCRPDFLASFASTANLGTKWGREGQGISVVAPLITMKKSEIISLGLKLGVDYSLTHSCYSPAMDGTACGHCDSCYYRRQGFQTLNQADPSQGG
ncbi:MAG: 7-cyano-7-deazaguanine synthase QueC [Mariprofundaceae bacterium]|nr:7-cyano-7-deazaguanine synthase QueC [Mariprofundaceae bacterium]